MTTHEEAQLIRTKKVWNTLSTVNGLAPETLVHIFEALSVETRPDRYCMVIPRTGSCRSPTFKQWLPLMGVCTYWRELICQTPTFWRSMSMEKADWARLCLQRSRTCTIDVWVGTDADITMLIPHIARIRSLTLSGFPLGGAQALKAFFLERFMTLEVLHIAQWAKYLGRVNDFELDVTSARFPKIRILKLADAAAPRETSIYSNLRSLLLNSCQFNFGLDEFIQFLSDGVHLEELELLHTFPGSPPASRTSQHRVVTLPGLKRLTLTYIGLKEIEDVLTWLSLPGVDEVRIVLTVTDTTVADFVATYPTLLPSNNVRCFPCVKHAEHLDLIVCGDFYIIEYGARRADRSVPPGRDFEIYVDPGGDDFWDTALPHGMDNLIQIFRGAPIQSLRLWGDLDAVNVESWTALLEAFPTLVNLELIGAGEGLVKNMWTALRCASGDSGRVVCQTLRHIELLKDLDDEYGQPLLVTDDGVFIPEEMLSCLQYRADNGTRLKYLGPFDMDSEPTDTNVAQLEALVDELDISIRGPESES